MQHAELLNAATLAILAVYADRSVGFDVSRRSLLELENLAFELVTNIEIMHLTTNNTVV